MQNAVKAKHIIIEIMLGLIFLLLLAVTADFVIIYFES